MMPSPTRSMSNMALRSLVWLLASSFVALVAHALIGFAGGDGVGGDDYALRAHVALGPVALAALILGATVLLGLVLRAVQSTIEADRFVARARRFGRTDALFAGLAIGGGGFALLLGMEFIEQFASAGRILGVEDALGGNLAIGIGIVACAAALVASLGLALARPLFATALRLAEAVVAWCLVAPFRPATGLRRGTSRPRNRRCRAAGRILSRSAGLRAPPLASV